MAIKTALNYAVLIAIGWKRNVNQYFNRFGIKAESSLGKLSF